MLKLLIKKQFSEMYAGLFFDQKKNKARTRGGTIAMIAMTVLLGLGVFGVMMTMLSNAICGPLTQAGMGWLYFTIMGLMALLLGVLGGAFAAYTHLYKGKDNDTLLSLPIPTRDIIASRILSVYFTVGGMVLVALLPAVIVYWITTGFTAGKVICGILFALAVSLLALVLSCLLGLLVARISTKMKNKSFVTVFISLLGMGLYYLFYFKFMDFIRTLTSSPESFARLEKIPGLKFFGQAGEGKWLPLLVVMALSLSLAGLTLFLLVRSFKKIITAADSVSRVKYKAREAKQKAPLRALLGKEKSRLTTNPGYMLNGAMGSIFLILLAGAALIKGPELMAHLGPAGGNMAKEILVIGAAGIIAFLAGSNNLTAPSVSLEGKQLWILKSAPVESSSVLKAKLGLHMIVTGVPVLLASLCCALVLKPGLMGGLLLILFPLLYILLFGAFGLMMGTLKPNLNWSNEMVPIKQSLPSMMTMFGGWFYGAAIVGLYFWVGQKMGGYLFLGIATLVTALLAGAVLLWLMTKGSERFDAL